MKATKLKPYQEPSLNRSVGISVLLHGAVVLFFTVQALVFPSEPIEFSRAVRVDIVDLPDKLPQAPAAPTPKPAPPKPEPPKPTPPKPEPPKPTPPKPQPPKPEAPKVDLNKARNKQQEALNRLKTQSAIERLKQEQQQRAQQEAAAQEVPTQIRGAVLSPGTSLTGLNKLQHDRYISDFDEHVRGYWRLPEWLATANLSARVLVKIDERGYVTSARIINSSGNPTYDDLVLGTVQKASPYPAPPEKFKDILAYDGITLGFPE